MGRCNNRRVQQAAQASRNTPSRARFSKPLPSSKRKAGRGNNKGRGDRGGGNTSTSSTGRSNTDRKHAATIDKISKRVQDKNRQVSIRRSGEHDPLRGVDISKLNEITLSDASIQLVTKLLRDLNVMDSLDNEDEKEEVEERLRDETDDAISDEQQQFAEDDENDVDNDSIFDEQQRFSGMNAGYSEYENEDDFLDLVPEKGTADEAVDSESCDLADTKEEIDNADTDVQVRESPVYVHLTTQLSFSEAQVEWACRAIQNWQVPVKTFGEQQKTSSDALDNDELALAMDWLCLHLTDDELKAGFRPNPKGMDRKPASTGLILAGTGRTKPIPHSSISVARPITSDQEWRETLKRQSRKLGFFRLGFQHEEAEKACDETMHVSEKVATEDDEDALRVMLSLLEKETLGDSLVIEEPGNQTDFDYAASEREQETQALEAIFDDHFKALPNKLKPGFDRYLLTVTPVDDLQRHGNTEGCRLHVLVRPGYPVLSPPLLLFTNPTLPPTLLRRVNVALILRAHESVGEPIIFAAMDFLSNNIHQMQIEFIKEQQAKEMKAEQLRMRREVGHDIEAQDESGGKLGRRQKAKVRTAEKAFNHNDIVEQEEQERLKRQEERLERIRSDQCSLRVKRTQRAVEEREKARIQEEAERASRAAMNAAFNRGESIEEARAAANAARKRSLFENGEEVSSSDDEGDPETAKKSGGLDVLQLMNGSIPKDNNEGMDETKLVKKRQPALASNSTPATTPATLAFMERLRKCYDDAVREKANRNKIEESVLKQTEDIERDAMETGYYHFSDPAEGETLDAATAESRIDHIPTPVPVPTGDLAVVMKDVIQLQNEQPWLISSEARAPTVHEEDVELTTEQRHERDEISKKLKEELTRKHKAADSWAKKDYNTGTKVNGNGGMPQLFHEMRSQRERLPAYAMKDEIVQTILSNQVTVISGDTGCGKTTQIPQLVLDDMIMRGHGAEANMIVTQPRRISAIGVSERIASERVERVGQTAGYSIRLENKRSAKTRLLLCTTGILLRRLQCDPDLASVSHVFVDEVHERDLNTDFLLIVLKDLLARRKSLKLVLMSATLNANSFSAFFGGCPVVSIPGRTFPVKEYRLEDVLQLTGYEVQENSDYALKTSESRSSRLSKSALRKMYYPKYSSSTISSLAIVNENVINYELIAKLVEHICLNDDEGAILIFLPGMAEITKTIEELYKKELFQSSKVVMYPLHSSLSTAEQAAIFEVPPQGIRKVVVATNIAETSITIEDVVYVVDAGRVKENRKDEVNEMPTLVETWVSRTSAKQRRGRAGRVREGIAYHLFSSHTYQYDMKEYQLPEMLRVGLEGLVLHILLLDLGEPTSFLAKAVDPPSALAMRNSLKLLEGLGAIEVEWEKSEPVTFSDSQVESKKEAGTSESPSCGIVSAESGLTALGFHLATLPVDARVGKIMIYGALFQCTDPALTIAASMSARSPFVSPFDKRDEADAARKEFALEGSDHLTTMNAFNQWKDMRYTKGEKAIRTILQESFLSRLTLFQMEDLRKQFADLLVDIGFLPRGFRLKGGHGRHSRGSNNRKPEDPRSVADAYSDNLPLIKAILCAGLYPNIIVAPRSLVRADGGMSDKQAGECAFQSLKGEVYLHPSTISFSERHLDSRYCCYHEIVRTSKTYVRDCTTVSEFALLLFGGSLKVYHTHGVVTVDNWLKFRISPKAAALVKHLRAQMESMLLKKIVSPTEDITGTNEAKALIQAVNMLFASEINVVPEQTGADIVRPWTGLPDDERQSSNSRRRLRNGGGQGGRSGRGRGRSRYQSTP